MGRMSVGKPVSDDQLNPTGSDADVPQCVESERCEGERTLYDGGFALPVRHFDCGGLMVDAKLRLGGGLPGRVVGTSSYTRDDCGLRRKAN